MRDYQQSTYGDAIADIYDQMHGAWEPTATVDTVAELAAGGQVLELGVGTGRVALPLADRGVKVTGVDVSSAMLARLREKDSTGLVTTVEANFADLDLDQRFKVVFVVNSLLQLNSVEEQLRCLRKVREHLEPDGVLVMEEANPVVFTSGGLQVFRITADELHLLAAQYDPVHQHYMGQHVIMRNGTTRLNPMVLRLTTPAEFDLMARMSDLRLRERWGDWSRTQPYLANSRSHVSVYDAVT